jgi:hypothetical protein
MTKHFALCAAAAMAALISAPVHSQIGIAPPKKAKPAESGGDDVAGAIEQLRGTDWAGAAQRLVELARDHQQEVLRAVAPLARDRDDTELAARASMVQRALITAHMTAEKRAELRARFRALEDAFLDCAKANGSADLDALRDAVTAMQESVDKEEPLDPRPLQVPLPAGTAQSPAPPLAGPGEEGYRMIEVDGKKVLVPKSELPEGMEYDAEFKNDGLWIRRFPNGKPAGKKKGGDTKSGEKNEKKPKKRSAR